MLGAAEVPGAADVVAVGAGLATAVCVDPAVGLGDMVGVGLGVPIDGSTRVPQPAKIRQVIAAVAIVARISSPQLQECQPKPM
jgi:hypothetical protein